MLLLLLLEDGGIRLRRWFIWGPREVSDILLEMLQCQAVAVQLGSESRGNWELEKSAAELEEGLEQ